eukprot:370497-Prorocentrum_minimum.AAC.1
MTQLLSSKSPGGRSHREAPEEDRVPAAWFDGKAALGTCGPLVGGVEPGGGLLLRLPRGEHRLPALLHRGAAEGVRKGAIGGPEAGGEIGGRSGGGGEASVKCSESREPQKPTKSEEYQKHL